MKKFSYLLLVMTLFLCFAGNAWGVSSVKNIYQFTFVYGENNPQLVCNMMGIVDESTKTILVNVPYGTDVTLLKPTIWTTSVKSPTSSSVSPASGAVQDFSSPVVYTCYAEDGSSQTYTVTVVAVSNIDKAITQFKFNNPLTNGIINEDAKTIAVNLPYGTLLDPADDNYGLFATVSIKGKSVVPTPGNYYVDYRNPLTYTVTAGDGSTQAYTVTVTAYSQTSPVYIDKAWAGNAIGTVVGTDKIYGSNAFSTIQKGITAVITGGTVNVYPGTYNQDEANSRDLLNGGIGTTDFNIFVDKSVTIQGVNASGEPITNYDDVEAFVTAKRNTPSGNLSTFFIQADNVTITGLDITGWADQDYYFKTISVIGNNATIKYCKMHNLDNVSNIYVYDPNYVASTNTSHIQSYRFEGNYFDAGGTYASGVRLSSGAGWTGAVANRVISGNTFTSGGYGVEFVGPGVDSWDVYPVGAATITSNSFSGAKKGSVVASGKYLDAQGYGPLDWNAILSGNTFSKAVIVKTTDGLVRSYDEGNYFFVRGIYNAIQPYPIDKVAQAGDVINVAAGTYTEAVKIFSKDHLTIQGVGDETIISKGLWGGYGFEIDNSDYITIQDLKIITEGWDLHGIYVDDDWVDGTGTGRGEEPSNYLTIHNTTISATGGAWDRLASGIYGGNATNGAHTGWNITDNRITADGCGIGLEDVTNSTVSGNIITITGHINILWLTMGYSLTNLVIRDNILNGATNTTWEEPAVLGEQTVVATSGFTGQLTGKTISVVSYHGNTADNYETRALRIGAGVSSVTADENKFLGSAEEALLNENTSSTVNAKYNWWGNASGPYNDPSNIGATGGEVSDYVEYTPWYTVDMGHAMLAVQDYGVKVTSVSAKKATLSWTRGDGTGSFVVVKLGAFGVGDLPVNYTEYPSQSLDFTTSIGAAKIIYYGTNTKCVLTGLTKNKTYYVRVFGYDGNPFDGTAQFNKVDNNKKFTTPWAKETPEGTDALAGTFTVGLIAPNPVVDNLNFALEVPVEQAFTIEVYDAEGRLANDYCQNQTFSSGTHNINMTLNNLSSGLYTLVVKTGADMAITQFIIAK